MADEHILQGMARTEFLLVTEEQYAVIQGLATSFKAQYTDMMEIPLVEIFIKAVGNVVGRKLDPLVDYRISLISGRDYRCPNCGLAMVGIEYPYGHPQRYDGVSEWRCDPCKLRFGRWTNQQLGQDIYEYPFGEKPKDSDTSNNGDAAS